MQESKAAAHGQEPSTKKRHRFESLRIPGEHSESVIELKDFIDTHHFKDDYMKGRLLVAVQQFDNSEHVNSKQYDLFQRLLIILSALTSFFIALEAIVVASAALKLSTLLLSLLVGILGNYLTSFNIQAKRGAYRHTRETLIAELYKFHESITPYTDATTKRTLFVAQVEEIIKTANAEWEKLHQPSPSQQTPDQNQQKQTLDQNQQKE
jgi:Protein of unknown function (DUF4231)